MELRTPLDVVPLRDDDYAKLYDLSNDLQEEIEAMHVEDGEVTEGSSGPEVQEVLAALRTWLTELNVPRSRLDDMRMLQIAQDELRRAGAKWLRHVEGKGQ
jgi:hypothetical protein